MSRFDQEWALVPTGARWTAALVALAFAALMGAIFLLPAFTAQGPKALRCSSPIFLLTLVGASRSRSTCCCWGTSAATRGGAG